MERVNNPPAAVAAAIQTIQQAAYAVESELIGHAIPAQTEAVAAIQAAPDTFLLARVEGEIAAVLGYERQGDNVHINRLAVAPAFFRRGLASRLLAAVLAVERDAASFTVSTAAANRPARQLYEKYGFDVVRERTRPDGLALVLLRRRVSRPHPDRRHLAGQ